ncbi:MAG TPA: hypothetical protein VJX74_14585 [Blastocatellia bacterium]|nr:hypothetical protein [Blastocatellia bacterium]
MTDETASSDLVSKEEAAEILGCKIRTVELYQQQSKLSVRYVKGQRGKKAQYDRAEVLALKENLASSTDGYQQRPTLALQTSSANPIASNQAVQALALALTASRGPVLINNKMSLSFDEAKEVSGYSEAKLRRAMAEKQLPYTTDGPHGSVRIKCADLTAWVESL